MSKITGLSLSAMCFTLAKVFDNRLANLLPDLIGREQSAFLKGRTITDNILLVQEIAYSISAHKRNKTFVRLRFPEKS